MSGTFLQQLVGSEELVRKSWLIEAVEDADLERSSEVELDLTGMSLPDAWSRVAKVFGISTDELAEHVAERFDLPVADLETSSKKARSVVPERFARRHLVYPLREDPGKLVVATCDPTDLDTEHSLAFASGLTPAFEIAAPEAIRKAIKSNYGGSGSTTRVVEGLLESSGDDVEDAMKMVDAVRVLEDEKPEEIDEREAEEAPVIKLANVILVEAVRRRASDIHIGPGPGGGAVRFRIDGVLQDYLQMPLSALNRVVSRIKIMSDLDITDRLRPQDGRARIMVDDEAYDLRISTVPTRESENAVIRILDPRGARKFEAIGMPERELDRFRELITHRDGIVIVTGPTGSGKTTTLYAAISELATGETNIMTVEDPVEYELPGVTQIQVEPEQDLTFASALRSILRQDPDVIFVGEIRDLETAEIAVQASTTGHLVLATLHTNSAIGIINRLADLGLDLFQIESVIRGALAQRLLRKFCDCAKPIEGELTDEERHLVERYGVRPTMRAAGCDDCMLTGYRGRIPVAEVFHMDYRLAELVSEGASPARLERAARKGGMRSMRETALERVEAGETSLQEVARVLGQRSDDGQGDDLSVESGTSVEAPDVVPAEPEPAEPEPADEELADETPLDPSAFVPENGRVARLDDIIRSGPVAGGLRKRRISREDEGAEEEETKTPWKPASKNDIGPETPAESQPDPGVEEGDEPIPARDDSSVSKRRESEEATISDAPEPAAPTASRPDAPEAPGRPRILVVDDDPQMRRYVRALLEHHDYEVTEARNGNDALEKLKVDPYSLMLLDLNMPKLGGEEVVSIVRASDSSALPIVVLTSSNGPSEVTMLEKGADDFVAKPIVPDKLVARVKANLRRAGIPAE